MIEKEHSRENLARTLWKSTDANSTTAANIVKQDLIVYKGRVPMIASIEAANAYIKAVRVGTQNGSKLRISDRTGIVRRNIVWHVLSVTYNLVSASSLRDTSHVMLFTIAICVDRKRELNFLIKKCTSGIYSVEIKQ